ncbi:fumarylacetoacetate hydrolase family protein [Streptomyces sp. NBC_01356]|uniref:fumarylacetoacetate hydrolase family protein n=1 Tax=Streptomyces sp. NBC_01356 TaxID=2903836 RepID=UPI002E372D6B|nr:fumarylacetoacetate hydrolase family protein [Streptomyces sp. NBC_01356]
MSALDLGNHTLPYGIFRPAGLAPRVGVGVRNLVLDLSRFIDSPDEFAQTTLNPFMAQGRARWHEVRKLVQQRVTAGVHAEQADVHAIDDVELLMPIDVADFVDFFSGIEHAVNMGRILRPEDADPLKPNYRSLPVGYHGRAGTVIPSGSEVVRPEGQVLTAGGPMLAQSERLDIEAELGYVVGTPSDRGNPVPADKFRDHVFGVLILIDWSARDIQSWEYQPLGPFLAKSFATTISNWVVPLEALDETGCTAGPAQSPPVLTYLDVPEPRNHAIQLEIELNGTVLSHPHSAGLYWSPAQQLAHMTRNGASLRTGDLYGTGTISSSDANAMGSLMEITWGGATEIRLLDGSTRRFLQDDDELVIRAWIAGDPHRSLGEARGRIRPRVE